MCALINRKTAAGRCCCQNGPATMMTTRTCARAAARLEGVHMKAAPPACPEVRNFHLSYARALRSGVRAPVGLASRVGGVYVRISRGGADVSSESYDAASRVAAGVFGMETKKDRQTLCFVKFGGGMYMPRVCSDSTSTAGEGVRLHSASGI